MLAVESSPFGQLDGGFVFRCLLLLVAFAPIAPAEAYEPRAAMSGNKLLNICESSAAWDRSACSAYVAGAMDQLEQMAFRDQVEYWAAFPSQVTIQQMADIVLKYLKEHPENRHYAGASNVRLAMEAAFPCS